MRKEAISPLRARMIEDMTARKLVVDTATSGPASGLRHFSSARRRRPRRKTSDGFSCISPKVA
jgi:hypothetical protein